MRHASHRRALLAARGGRGGAFMRAALAGALALAVDLDAATGAGADPNQPVSSRAVAVPEAPGSGEGIAGAVVDQRGTPLADVFVQVTPLDPAAGPVPEIAITTDRRGRYQWPLPPGRYAVSIAAPEFAPQSKEIVVEPGRLADLDFVVAAAPR